LLGYRNIYLLIKFEIFRKWGKKCSSGAKSNGFEKKILREHIRKYFLKSGENAPLWGKSEHP